MKSILLLLTCLVNASWSLAQPLCEATDALQPTDSWQTVSGSYGQDGWVIYAVPMDLGVTYEFKTGCGNGAGADHDTYIEWMTPACMVILGNDNACENGSSLLSFESFFSDGIVLWLRVRGAQGEAGSFTMAYRSVGGMPGQCNACPSFDLQLYPSSLWQIAQGSYGSEGCAVHRIFTTPGAAYEFKTGCGDGASADHNTRIVVQQNGCQVVVEDDDECEQGRSAVSWTAPMSGSAITFVQVSGSGGAAGAYDLAYRKIGGNGSVCGPCNAFDHSLGVSDTWANYTSSYLPGGCQVYRVQVVEGYQYTFKTGCGNGAYSDHPSRIELFDTGCELLASDVDGCGDDGALLEYVASQTGSLYVRVSSVDGSGGVHTLAFRRSGVCRTCPDHDQEFTPTLQWQTTEASYFNGGCSQYRMNLQAGHTYVFKTGCGDGAQADHSAGVELYDSACMLLEQANGNCVGNGARLFHMPVLSGAYYVKVQGITNGLVGTHTLAFKDLGTSADQCLGTEPIGISDGSSVQLTGSVMEATSVGDFGPNSPWSGQAAVWYAFELDEMCQSFVVSYCGTQPVWTSTLGVLLDGCPGDDAVVGYIEPWWPCTDGNSTYAFWVPPGVYYLPIVLDSSNPGDGAYTITATCSNIVLGDVDGRSASGWSLYPNPGNDEVFLVTEEQLRGAVVFLFDAMGRQVWEGRITATPARIPTETLAPGTYTVQVRTEDRILSRRWLKY